jgi:hypothetical protein
VAHRVCQCLQRNQRVANLDQPRSACSARLDDDCRRAARDHIVDKRVPIEPWTPKRDEQIPLSHRSAVGDDLTNRPIEIARMPLSVDGARNPGKGQVQLAHPAPDFKRRASSASCATSMSSNAIVRPAIS